MTNEERELAAIKSIYQIIKREFCYEYQRSFGNSGWVRKYYDGEGKDESSANIKWYMELPTLLE